MDLPKQEADVIPSHILQVITCSIASCDGSGGLSDRVAECVRLSTMGALPTYSAWSATGICQAIGGQVAGLTFALTAENRGSTPALGHPASLQVFCASDYHLAKPALAAHARSHAIYKGEKFSGHAPLTIEYSFQL